MTKDVTEAWHPWEGNVKRSCQLFAFAAVDDDCRVDMERTVVVELDDGECDNKESGEKGHWEYYKLLARIRYRIVNCNITYGGRLSAF